MAMASLTPDIALGGPIDTAITSPPWPFESLRAKVAK